MILFPKSEMYDYSGIVIYYTLMKNIFKGVYTFFSASMQTVEDTSV